MKYDGNKPIRLSKHALEQCKARGTNREEIIIAITQTQWVAARNNKFESKYIFQYDAEWSGKFYAIKEVRPIFVEETSEIVVVTVITYYN